MQPPLADNREDMDEMTAGIGHFSRFQNVSLESSKSGYLTVAIDSGVSPCEMHRGVRESKRNEGEHAEAGVEGWRARRILHPRPVPPKCALDYKV